MIQICFTLVDTHIYRCPFRDVGSKWIQLGNDADFEQEPSETENKHMRDSALFNLVYGSNPTSGLKWSGPAVGHVQPTTVGNLLQYIHVMSLSVIMKLTYKLTWDQTNPRLNLQDYFSVSVWVTVSFERSTVKVQMICSTNGS